MLRFLTLLLAAIMVALMLGASPSGDPEFDRLISLARVADTAYDAEVADAWDKGKPKTRDQFDWLVVNILWKFKEEGIVAQPVMPSSVTFAEYGPDRSSVAGRYAPWTGQVTLNIRYLADPTWDEPYYATLIHELVHAQGPKVVKDFNEAGTEVLTFEVLAAFANENYPGMRAAFLDKLRRYALRTAYTVARWGDRVPQTIAGANPRSAVAIGRPTPEPNKALMAIVDQTTADIFDDAEERDVAKALRYRNSPLYPGDFRAVEAAYRAAPLGVLLASVCDDDPTLIEQMRVEEVAHYPYVQPLRAVRADDFDALLREIGAC